MPNLNPACADCKAKKKRCIHRIQPVKVAEAEAVPASMSSPSAPAVVPTPAPTPAPVEAPGAATRGRRKAAEAKKEKGPAPADSSDELSSVPSESEPKPVVKKPIKRTRRAKPAALSQNKAPNLPAENINAASTMSVHQVFACKLRGNLQELQERMRTFDVAHRDVMAGSLPVLQERVQRLDEAHHDVQASGQTIQNTVEGWIQTWAVSGC